MAAVVAVLAALAAAPAQAGRWDLPDFDTGGAPFTLEADTIDFDRATTTIRARGRAVLTYEGRELVADTITLNTETREARAEGSVELHAPEGDLRAETWDLDFADETSVVVDVHVRSEARQFVLDARRLEKCPDGVYKVEDGAFTSCVCPDPDDRVPWRFRVGEAEFIPEDAVRARDLTVEVLDVPVMKSPYGYAPTATRRRSGWLIPHVSYSSDDGAGLTLPFYWAPHRSYDATFFFEGYTERGPKPGAEFRYRPMRDLTGSAYATGLYDFVEDEGRWGVRWSHRQRLPGGLRIKVELAQIGDDAFVRDFREWKAERTSRFLTTTTIVDRAFEDWWVGSTFLYDEDLLFEGTNAFVPQTAPNVALEQVPTPLLGLPLWTSIAASANQYVRRRGFDQQRGDAAGFLELPLPLGPYLYVRPYGGARGTWLRNDLDEGEAFRGTTEVGVEVSTELIGSFGSAERPWFHVLRPVFRYQYIDTFHDDRRRVFDGLDALDDRNLLLAGVEQSWWGHGPWDSGGVRELGRLDAYAGFDFVEERRNATTPRDRRRPIGHVLARAILFPLKGLFVEGDVAVDPNRGGTGLRTAGVGIGYREGDWRGALRYRRGKTFELDAVSRTDVITPYDLPERIGEIPDQFAAALEFPLVPGRLNGSAGARWVDAGGGKFEYEFGVEYISACKCWSVEGTLEREERPSDTTFNVRFNLLGLQ